MRDLNQFLLLSPQAADGFLLRGSAYQGLNRYLAAVEDFTSAIGLGSPRSAYALANRGVCHVGLGDKAKARKDLEAALQVGVKEAQQYIDRYLNLGCRNEAPFGESGGQVPTSFFPPMSRTGGYRSLP